ncbi:hypothetical protein A7D16_18040 [Xanthomonas nasturtii]|uniref:hypothetical protein n=1 Tax=Xanthomonas nasturtii TaxID=1843581 RepID=UPI0007E3674B|nr:hypothetical protein [Xanthomonas nasturtii]OAX86841.1 hypothetical protein A7D16_18040 [Xanthomonas nasturtii]
MCLPRRHSPPRRRALRSAVLSLSIGLVACSQQPPFPSQTATPAEALCAMVAEPPLDEPPTDLRADGMQQLSLASRCASALRRHR